MKLSMDRWLRFVIVCLSVFAANPSFAVPSVKELIIKTAEGVKVETLLMYPEQNSAEALGVVVMNHGFLMSNSYYRNVLAAVAAQGFLVVAPQTIPAGGSPIGKPSTAVEAQYTTDVIAWMTKHAADRIGQAVDFNRLALVNHSRGSKIAWTMLRQGLVKAQAIAAIDPVDGTQDGTGLSTTGVTLQIPALIIGTGLGGKTKLGAACAPTNVSYQVFWKTAVQSPSWLLVAKDYGHMDFFDDGVNCGLTCSLCVTAAKEKSHADFRNWMGATIGAFLRGIVWSDSNSLDSVEDNAFHLSLTSERR